MLQSRRTTSILGLVLLFTWNVPVTADSQEGAIDYAITHERRLRNLQTSAPVNYNDDTVINDTVRRVLINPYNVTLTGSTTSNVFGQSNLNDLYEIQERVIVSYIQGVQNVSTLGYVLLGDITSSLANDTTTVLNMRTGKALFQKRQSTDVLPDESTLNAWIAAAINQYFAPALQQTTQYSYISSASYGSDSSLIAANNGTTSTPTGNVSGIVNQPTNSNSSHSNAPPVGVIAGSCLGVVAVAGLLAMLLVNNQQKRSTKVDYIEQHNSKDESTLFPAEQAQDDLQNIFGSASDDVGDSKSVVSSVPSGISLALAHIHRGMVSSPSVLSTSSASTDHSDPTGGSPPRQMVAGRPGILGAAPMLLDNDNRSTDGNESDFTVNTEAGDSLAVKSIPARHPPSQYQLHHADSMTAMERESFERDRPASIQKDMLTTTWSGLTQPISNCKPQSESVLAPSHITASEERMARLERKPSNSRDDGLLVFEQASQDSHSASAFTKITPPSQVGRMGRSGEV
jgi:hypothetical protein